jgi:hypothetical protein
VLFLDLLDNECSPTREGRKEGMSKSMAVPLSSVIEAPDSGRADVPISDPGVLPSHLSP